MRRFLTVVILVGGLMFTAMPGAQAATKCSGWVVNGPVAVKGCVSHHSSQLIKHTYTVRNVGVQDLRVSAFAVAFINGSSVGTFGNDSGFLPAGKYRKWTEFSTRLKGKRYKTTAYGKTSNPNTTYKTAKSPRIVG